MNAQAGSGGGSRAFGQPGMEPRWAHANKDGAGTAYASSSRVWFTLWRGILTEIYYPTVDRPQVRDLQYLVTDGETFFHEEKRHLRSVVTRLARHALGYRIVNADPQERYTIIKEVLADPHLPAVLQHTRLQGDGRRLRRLRLYVLCAPHLNGQGWHNTGKVIEVAGRRLLAAEADGVALVLGSTMPFSRLSCGYVGRSDGWTDLSDNLRMDWEFAEATDGNIALTGEVALDEARAFTLAIALGDNLHHATATLLQALGVPFSSQRARFEQQWDRACRRMLPLERASGDGGTLYHTSASLLLAHEDKMYPGAMIASLSIPWGEVRGDEGTGGYHLVWTRDMVHSATGLLATGNTETALRALLYLAASQRADGGFPQNFWIDGTPHWMGIQLDEVAFPILLAWHLHRARTLGDVDPYPLALSAAAFLIRHGPATHQERWEEAAGYSPSTLAATIAALICAAVFARERGDEATARFLEEYADFLECHIEAWTMTTEGTLVPGISRHYIRIHPADPDDPERGEDPNTGTLTVANRPPGAPGQFPAKEIVDAGFLELVRYGIRRPGDSLIVDSLQVVDAVLKVETPFGSAWRRYNHDGYGQRDDGGPYLGWGRGRAWPLLTGERGHYELAAGRDPRPLLRALEGFASSAGLLPEQVWDGPDRPEQHLFRGGPTGAAMPLMWAHAEYVKLLRSAVDGRVFDLVPEVERRYIRDRSACRRLQVWAPNRHPRLVRAGDTLRIQVPASFRLRWSTDEWQRVEDTPSVATALGVEFVDIPIPMAQRAPIRFTLYWTDQARWEGRDYEVAVVPGHGG